MNIEIQVDEPMPNIPLIAVKHSDSGMIRFIAPSSLLPRTFPTIAESIIILSDIDADISTDGKKNSVNFLFTSLPFLAGNEDMLFATFTASFIYIYSNYITFSQYFQFIFAYF